jgi:hypothetical protein
VIGRSGDRRAYAALLLALLSLPAFPLQEGGGSICVDMLPKPVGGRHGAGPPSVWCDAGKYSFKLDAQPIRPWPENAPIKIENLEVAARHRVIVFCGGKPMESATFSFSDLKTRKLCVFLNDLYWTIQVWDTKEAPWCHCK